MQQALALEAKGGEGNEVAWAKGDAAEYGYEYGADGVITWEPGKVTDVVTDVLVLFDSDKKTGETMRSDDANLRRVTGEGPYMRKDDKVTYLYGRKREPGVVSEALTTVVVLFTSDGMEDDFQLPDDKLRPPTAG